MAFTPSYNILDKDTHNMVVEALKSGGIGYTEADGTVHKISTDYVEGGGGGADIETNFDFIITAGESAPSANLTVAEIAEIGEMGWANVKIISPDQEGSPMDGVYQYYVGYDNSHDPDRVVFICDPIDAIRKMGTNGEDITYNEGDPAGTINGFGFDMFGLVYLADGTLAPLTGTLHIGSESGGDGDGDGGGNMIIEFFRTGTTYSCSATFAEIDNAISDGKVPIGITPISNSAYLNEINENYFTFLSTSLDNTDILFEFFTVYSTNEVLYVQKTVATTQAPN